MRPEPGTTIGGVYVVEGLLGEGGMGSVWSARVSETGERVALKLMRPSAAEHRGRFEREARAALAIKHPNVRGVRELVDWGGAPVMVMDLLEGAGLDAVLQPGVAMATADAATILVQLVSAVGAMHAGGVVHRDLKPANVFLVDRSPERVKVLDFGIAKVEAGEDDDASLAATITSTPIGTPTFMAPEQILGEPTADDRIDVWAIGIIAYTLLSGVLPTEAENVGQVMKKVLTGDIAPLEAVAPRAPEDLRLLVGRALALAPDARPELSEMREALGRHARIAAAAFGPTRVRRAGTTTRRAAESLAARDTQPTPAIRHGLPRAATTFVGRGATVRAVRERVQPGSLLTLTGAGGSGKTRLAIEAARGLVDRHPGGVWFADLARVAEEGRVDSVLMAALPPCRGASSWHAALDDLASAGSILLVVDNCEHLIETSALLVEAILERCPEVAVLATSREALGVTGEGTLVVEPLEVPPAGLVEPLPRLLGYESVALFVDRARLTDPTFAPDAGEARAVVEICRRLDGLPLAIELAAARVRVLGVGELARRISDHLDLLSSGARTAVPRHKTLRAAIAWSHALLSPEQRRVHRALGVFEGSFGLAAALAVASAEDGGSDGHARALDLVSGLVEKSLLGVDRRSGQPRFRLLETVRAFAREELEREGEREAASERHAAFHVDEAERWLLDGAPSSRLELEIDDVLAAERFVASRPDGPRRSGVLLLGVEEYLVASGLGPLGTAWADRVLASSATLEPALVARALRAAANFRIFTGAYDEAHPFAVRAVSAARALGDVGLLGNALNTLGLVADRRLDLDAAETIYLEALDCFLAVRARRTSAALNNLGDIAFARGDLALALERQRRALAEVRRAGDDNVAPIVLSIVALLLAHVGSAEEARAHLGEAAALARRTRALRAAADTLDAATHVAERAGSFERALRWYAAAAALRIRLRTPTDDYYRVFHEAAAGRATDALGTEASAVARQAGEGLDVHEALEEIALWLAERG